MKWPTVPNDVVDWIRSIIQVANNDATERLVNQPNVRETSLDDALINTVARFAAPKELPSGAVVMLEVHNIGGLRQFDKWELADIAFVVHISMNGQPLNQKIGLLQSKRLYPKNFDVDTDDPISFKLGLNGLIQPSSGNTLSKVQREFEFLATSTYGAIKFPDEQLKRILKFHEKFGEAIYYLLYNPSEIPFRTVLPAANYQSVTFPPEGARVVRAQTVNDAITKTIKNSKSPSNTTIKGIAKFEYWRLEHWVADLLLRCKVGRPYSAADSELLQRLIYRRSGPIGAAIRINIDLPEGEMRPR